MLGILTSSILFILIIGGIRKTSFLIAFLFIFFALEVALQASVSLFRTSNQLANYLLVFAIGFGFLKSMIEQKSPAKGTLNLAYAILIIIFLWSILSLVWSPAKPDEHNHGSNIMIDESPYVILILVISLYLIDGLADWISTQKIILCVGSLIVTSVILNPEFTVRYGRIGVVLDGVQRTSPLAIGEMGGTLAIISALTNSTTKKSLYVFLSIVGFILGISLALYSGSRGQTVFAIICCLIFIPFSRKIKSVKNFIGLTTSVCIGLILFYYVFNSVSGVSDVDRWKSSGVDDATGIRLANIEILFSSFIKNPLSWLIGLGFNAFSTLGNDLGQGYSHCTFIDVLCELGIPMFAGLIIICIITIKSAVRLFFRYQDLPTERSAVATLIALCIYQFFLCNKQGNLWAATYFFFICMTIIRIDIREALNLTKISTTNDDIYYSDIIDENNK